MMKKSQGESVEMNRLLQQKLQELPDLPGVYIMKDAGGSIIYVGKATSLKSRVRSYFQSPAGLSPKTIALVSKIADLETVVVDSPADALLLESNLIKEHRPYYNIRLKDDKHYPYLQLTLNEDYPRMLVARRAKNDGNLYFGPYSSPAAMNKTVMLIKNIFPLRTCSGKAWKKEQRACLNAHIGRCLAPCEGKISKEEYAELVEQVTLFLQGKTKALSKDIEKEMKEASAELRFEEAARLRDQLQALQEVQKQQVLDQSGKGGNYDLVAVAVKEEQCVVQVFFVRQGKVVGREHFFMLNAEEGQEAVLLSRFLQEYYGDGTSAPPDIYCNHLPEEAGELAELFSAKAGRRISFSVPQRGDKKRLLNLVEKNADLVLFQTINSRERQEEKNARALEALRLELGLKSAPSRIECYDISHIQGSSTVGSMVVFINGVSAPKYYRRFRIKQVEGINDFASLQEVISRRWQRGLEERAKGLGSFDFGNFPDLMVIDGGLGQLSAVCEKLKELGAGKTAVISLAKRQEEVFIPGRSTPLLLPLDSPALQLLQRLRDEAHRFAITYHRNLRGKSQTASALDEIPGIGPKRRQSLLAVFGSLKAMQKASLDQLKHVPGMTDKAAKQLYDYLQGLQKSSQDSLPE